MTNRRFGPIKLVQIYICYYFGLIHKNLVPSCFHCFAFPISGVGSCDNYYGSHDLNPCQNFFVPTENFGVNKISKSVYLFAFMKNLISMKP